jgi:hypothetical protein
MNNVILLVKNVVVKVQKNDISGYQFLGFFYLFLIIACHN